MFQGETTTKPLWPAAQLEPVTAEVLGGRRWSAAPAEVAPRRDELVRTGPGRDALLRRVARIADIVAVSLLLLVVELTGMVEAETPAGAGNLLLAVLGISAWLLLAAAHDHHDARRWHIDRRTADDVGTAAQLAVLWTGAMVALLWVVGGAEEVRITAALGFWALTVGTALVARTATRAFSRRRPWFRQNVLVIGIAGDTAPVARRLERDPRSGMHVVACADPSQPVLSTSAHGAAAPPGHDDAWLTDLVEHLGADRVVLAGPPPTAVESVLRHLAETRVRVDVLLPSTELFGHADIQQAGGLPIWTLGPARVSRPQLAAKRAIDVIVAGLALIVVAPVMALCALAIRLDSPGPVFFRQVRVGRGGCRFTVVKLRSMHVDAESRKADVAALSFHGGGNRSGMFKIRDDPRISRAGRVLRRTSLDELPQLINVVRGDMSLVGPRPLIDNEDRQIAGDAHRRRVSVRPGLTGPWQVHGRSEVPFEEMVRLDCHYAASMSLRSDFKLLLRTVGAVLQARGAY